MTSTDFTAQLVSELNLPRHGVAAVIQLLQDGNTIPFIARYRKEATGNLDEVQIRTIQERLLYLKEFEERRTTIIDSIKSQGKLTDALLKQIMECTTKTELEDLYLPFKPKRRTRAMIAREKGLEPLALRLLEQPLVGNPEAEALPFVNAERGVNDIQEALAGARDIAAEIIAENVTVRSTIRDLFAKEGLIVSKVVEGKNAAPTKFEQYYDFKEIITKIPSHRYLAIRRGEREGILEFSIQIDPAPALASIAAIVKLNGKSPFCMQLDQTISDTYKRLLLPTIETDVRVELKMQSDRAAVDVFAANLRNLLLAPPLGGKPVIGIDPGFRTGCKCAALDATGKYLDTITIYLTEGNYKKQLLEFISKYKPAAIGIGNGTGGRETEAFVRSLTECIVVSVSESGASVYSASDIAREEFPELDLTIRGAISIARRLQDPLAELVKVDPKAIGVGQYQHDVYQQLLQDKLTEVVESCVNHVGVELNTASAPLLSNVAGIGAALATKIVKFRETNGAFNSRADLLRVPGLGARTFEQAAGFLRLKAGAHPLDASAVHPERYPLVETIAKDLSVPLNALIGNTSVIDQIDIKRYFTHSLNELTLKDIIDELKKPGRDPRTTFEKPCFRDDVSKISDLTVGMKLEGIVTNVTAFGAFVDIGVHQDGLIHISELTDRYIKDPSEVVQVGTKIKVEVLTVDPERKRISLTARQKKSQPKPPQKASFNESPFSQLRF